MQGDAPRASRDDARGYLLALAEGVMDEANRELRDPEAAEILERGERLIRDLSAADLRSFGLFQRWVHACEALSESVCSARSARARTARSYETMEELYQDAAAQASGASPHAVWDARDHGRRRRLEARLARRFGAEEALLLSSGASGIAVATCGLTRGATALVGRGLAPETASYLTGHLGAAGVKIVRVSQSDGAGVLEALRVLRPEIAFFETATLTPQSEVPCGADGWFAASPSTLFVVDNSAQSLLTPWFGPDKDPRRRLLVVEDGARYLCPRAMCGLVYGPAPLVSWARERARATGQLLQERAFNAIRYAEIDHLGWRLARHTANVRVFVSDLLELPEIEVRVLGSGGDLEEAGRVLSGGAGGLVFVRMRAPGGRETKHRRLLARWQAHARKRGAWVPVRDGFGWPDTTARLFEDDGDAPERSCLRISIGVEPEAIVRDLSRALGAAALETAGLGSESDGG